MITGRCESGRAKIKFASDKQTTVLVELKFVPITIIGFICGCTKALKFADEKFISRFKRAIKPVRTSTEKISRKSPRLESSLRINLRVHGMSSGWNLIAIAEHRGGREMCNKRIYDARGV